MKKKTVGVVVARFQTIELHDGHRYLLDTVCAKHDEVLVVLGSGRARASKRYPLDYETRRAMVQEAYPATKVAELADERLDKVWSEKLDRLIAGLYPGHTVRLYGSRDSFLATYVGQYKTYAVEPLSNISATMLRQQANQAVANADFRRGVIYTHERRADQAYGTVDVAILKPETRQVLLGRKQGDGGAYRFIGGFIDPTDHSLEYTVRREVREEVGDIEIASLEYVTSTKIDDWRYRGTADGIISTLFAATYVFGRVAAGDDVDEVVWVPWNKFQEKLVPEHQFFGEKLANYLANNY